MKTSPATSWLLSLRILTGSALLLAALQARPETHRAMRFHAQTPAEARAWQQAAREKLIALMMGGRPETVPLAPQILKRLEVPQEGNILEELTLQIRPDRRVHLWLSRPARPRTPVGAILALHGHGGSGEQIVRGKSLYWYGAALSRMGWVVVAPDIGQHELQDPRGSLMGERTWDTLRCLEYMAALPEVDPARLAVAGLSLGGETAMYVAALDERVQLTCSSGWLTTVANMKNGHCPCFNFNGLEETFDFSDIFALIAPRTLICELGEGERAPGGFPVEIGRQAFQEILAAYRVFEAESNLTLTVHPGGHVFDGREFFPRARAAMAQDTPSSAVQESLTQGRKMWDQPRPVPEDAPAFRIAEKNARLANEALVRCRRYVDGWLAQADPVSGLIPRNLRESRDFWNGRDAAADNYPFMVLTAAITDRPLLDGRLLDMLHMETRLTSRVGRLPDDYSFSRRSWRRETLDMDQLIFDGAEYVKDGLLPITEYLGPSPWSERMKGIIDDIWQFAPIGTPFGLIPTRNFEVCGDLLQACARLYWFTGDRKYLEWGFRLGDYFLLGGNHPTRQATRLRLIDHGCEVVNGLTELYVAAAHAQPEKHRAYREPMRRLFDDILAKGRNQDGLLYSWFNPQTGEHSQDLCDTWGYAYDGFYTMWLIDKTDSYRATVQMTLGNLAGKYVGACWGDRSADGFADSIEGALNLLNREPDSSAAEWIDSQTRLMWDMQKPDGIIEGWHGDGNFARTSLMYGLWKTQGLTLQPWRPDVQVGAHLDHGVLHVTLSATQAWSGRLVFDRPRHKLFMRLPLDYARINQFPEWFTALADAEYQVRSTRGDSRLQRGQALWEGVALQLEAGRSLGLEVRRR